MVDYDHKFENEIRKHWLDTYFSKKEIDGFSVLRNVNEQDEWLVEPYIKTKFEDLSDSDFEFSLKEYQKFLFSNDFAEIVSVESEDSNRLKLDFSKWKEITLRKLFDVKGSKTTDKKILDREYSERKKYPYVTTQAKNNGVRGFYDKWTDEGNVLTIDSAVAGFCSFQPLNFTASDHVEKLIPKFELNVYNALFLTTIINKERYRYSYGRKFNQPYIKETIIKLPFINDSPDWTFIENYMKGLRCSKYVDANFK